MTKVIALANQKGGVGKTTSCVNLGAALVKLQQRVLLVDLDPQGNATMGSGVDKLDLEQSVNEVLLGTVQLSDVVLTGVPAGYDLLPANGDLTQAEILLVGVDNREQVLKNIISDQLSSYDYILLDCPPSLNMLTLNALGAASSVIIPVQCEYYALEGLSALLSTIAYVQKTFNPGLKLEGIIKTMFDARNRLGVDVAKQLEEHFADKVYKTVIPRNVRLAEAPSHGLPVILYDQHSKGALAYLKLASEVLAKNKVRAEAV